MLVSVALLSSFAFANAATLSPRAIRSDGTKETLEWWENEKPAGAPGDNKGTRPDLCSPAFGEQPVSVAHSSVVFGIGKDGISEGKSLTAQPDAFEKALLVIKPITGSHVPTRYTLTSFNDTSLNIVGKAYTDLVWARPNRDPNQVFTVACSANCPPAGPKLSDGILAGKDCTIHHVPSGQCVQIGDGPGTGNKGDAIFLEKCDNTESQRFNFPTTISAHSSLEGDDGASPLKPSPGQDDICHPDFDLFPYSVHNSAIELSTVNGAADGKQVKASNKPFQKALFNFKKHSGSTPQYSLTLFNDTSLGLSIGGNNNGEIVFKTKKDGNVDQLFIIECASGCSPGGRLTSDGSFIGDGCRIRSVAMPKQCVQIDTPASGHEDRSVNLVPCATTPIDAQRFNILKTVSGIPTPKVDEKTRKQFRIAVGSDGTLDFIGASGIHAAPGDQVTFEFRQGNHSVIESSFDKPCQPLPSAFNGVKSDFEPVGADQHSEFPEFTITVNDTAPIWGYCSQAGHCNKGMVFVINEPSHGNKTFESFQKLAEAHSDDNKDTSHPVANTNDQKLFGAAADSDESVLGDQKSLLRNSYIVMALLAAVLIALIIVIVLLARRGGAGLKGTATRGKYAKVTLPQNKGADEDYSFTHPAETRYSD